MVPKMNRSVKLFLVAMVALATAFVFVAVNESESDDAATISLDAMYIYNNGGASYPAGTVININIDYEEEGPDVMEYIPYPLSITVPGTVRIDKVFAETGDIVNSVNVNFTSSSGTYYTVTFKANHTGYGTVSPATVTVARGTTYSTNGPVMTFSDGQSARANSTSSQGGGYDYSFTSWNSNSGTINANKGITANFTRTAKAFTVTFDATTNGGTLSGSSTKTVTYGSTYGALPTATKSGYTFNGWYTAASGGTKITSSSTVVTTTNQTLYAQFSKTAYTMSAYVADSDWGTVYIRNVTQNTTSPTGTYVTLNAYSGDIVRFYATANTGYHFWYWWYAIISEDVGSNNYYQITVTGNEDLSANFEGTSYTVTFNATANGGTLSGSSTKTVTHGNSYGTLPSATKTNNTFMGWYTATTGGTLITSSSTVSITANQTLYAQFVENSRTVNIYRPTNGSITYNGTPITSSVTYTLTEGTNFTLVATPANGYSFDEWAVHYQESEDIYYSSNPTLNWTVDGDVDITASFVASTYTVTFDATTNGGTLSGSSTKTVTYGSTYGALPTATKSGYHFMGWFTAATGGTEITSSSTVENPSDHTLYAQFMENAYDITVYRPNNGSITFNGSEIVFTTSQKVYTLAEASNFTLVAIPNEGYRFVEWTVHYQESEDIYYSSNPTLDWTVDAYVDITASFEEYVAPDVWWFNDYANGSVEIVFDFTGLSNSYSHKLTIPLWQYNGAETSLEDDPHGLLQFSQTPYTLVIENSYDSDLRVSVLNGNDVVKGPITMRIGNWQQYALEIDTQKGLVYFKGIHNILDRITQPFSFVNYTVTYSAIAADVSDVINGMAIERIYHEDNNGTVHPHFQVSRTMTYLNTYGFVMTDPTINIIEQFPNYNDLRLNFYSFAYYGEDVTINGHTMQVQNADIVLYYIPQGTPIYDPGHTYIVGYYDKNVIGEQGDPDAKELRTPLSNIYITWNGIKSENDEDRICSLTFVDSKLTIDMGNFLPNDLTVSFTGVWYFTTAIYEPYTAKETSYEMDWWKLSSLDRNGFILIFDLIIIIGYIVANRIYVPGFMDKCVVIGALVFSFILLAV